MLIFLAAFLPTLFSIFRSRAALELENLALRHQIGVLQRSVRKRPRLTPLDRLLWVWLFAIWSDWRSALAIVQPRDCHCLASQELSPLLALEGPTWQDRQSHGCPRGPTSPPQHEHRGSEL